MFFALFSFSLCRLLLSDNDERRFLSWMRANNFLYVGDEYHFRLGIFLQNHRRVQDFNRHPHSFRVGLNKFAAFTPSEYTNLLGHRQTPREVFERGTQGPRDVKTISENFDWREKGIVNYIKNQGQCGSCWAFSVVQALESQYALVYHQLYDLSEQNLVDCCDTSYGCDGGYQDRAFDYVLEKQNGLWMKQSDYPYTATGGTCKFDQSKGVCKFYSYFRPTTTKNEDEIAASCENDGVVSVAIDASLWDFNFYEGGIFDDPHCFNNFTDHAVGIVGFGVENGTKYWIVRNSWGPDWGEDGYIRMVRNKNNQCGIANDPLTPRVTQ